MAPSADSMNGGSPAAIVSGVRLCDGGQLCERGRPDGGNSWAATCADPTRGCTRRESIAPAVIRGRLRSERDRREGGDFSGSTSPPSDKECECVGLETSAHLIRAMIVLATRARPCEVLSTRSSGRKRSSGPSPFAEHDARNFSTFDLRSMPSSCASICGIDPGRTLFRSLMNPLEHVLELQSTTCWGQRKRTK